MSLPQGFEVVSTPSVKPHQASGLPVGFEVVSTPEPAAKKSMFTRVIDAVDNFAKDPIGNIIGKREPQEAVQTPKAKTQPTPVQKVEAAKPKGTTPWDNLMQSPTKIDTRFVTSDPKQVKAAIDSDHKAKQDKEDKLNALLNDAPIEDATLETVFSLGGAVKAGVGLAGMLSKSKEIAAEGAKSFAKGNAFAAGDMAGQAGAEVGMEAADAVMSDDFKKNHETAAELIKAGAGLVLGGVAGYKAEVNRLNQMQYQAAQDIIDSSAQHLGVEVPKAQAHPIQHDEAIAKSLNEEYTTPAPKVEQEKVSELDVAQRALRILEGTGGSAPTEPVAC